jgi:CheY-like chemotaxis protein
VAEQERLNKLESVGTLAGGIAHDFNNILGAIVGNISLAKAEVSPSQDVYALLTDAEKAVMRAKDLTRRLLTFAQGGTPVKKQSQLRDMIRDTANFATAGTPVKCRFSIAAELWPCEVDEGQISQVVHNLVLNARQAMPSGGWIDITAENIALSEEQRLGKSLPLSNGDYVRIIIEDHGIGIPLQYVNKIFDPYFTTKQQGSGLGLASCLSIMREHKGHISVDSKPGEGTTFYVYLPAAPGATIPGSQIEDKEIIRLTGKILVMDDEPALRETIKSMLTRMGFERVDTAGNGEEALKLYREAMDIKETFDAVILDLTVPGGMGGSETLGKLLEINPGVVAIVSSGYATEPVMADFGKYGFKGVIIKPYTFDDLFKTMHSIMGSRNPA